MKFLGIFLMLGGYVLLYAGFADHGKFATMPWAGLFMDAYVGPKPKTSTKTESV